MADINIIEQNIVNTLETNFMPYAMSVIISRAIPEIDGFKPAHRKLLYTMYKMGLLTGARVKSSNVVGQTMALNPHGDGAIYETLVRLTRGNDALLHPFIDSKGNFGKHFSRDMAYAASRYTEVKLDGICSEIFRDIDKNTVDFVDNYDGRLKEPVLFPTAFPNMLVTPNQGIGVSLASSICSFNLKEVCEATAAYIKNKEADLGKYLPAPDFTTGGELIYNKAEMDGIYKTGRGSFKVRARWRYDKKNSCIEIYEIPYTTTIEAVIDKIVSLVKTGRIRDVNDVRNETDLNGMKITLDIKRSCNHEHLMHRLFSLTQLSDSYSCNFNLLVDGKPRTMGIREILEQWLIFRVSCVRRQTQYDLEKKTEKLELLAGLSKILLDIDKAIKIIRETEEDSQVLQNLMDGFGIGRNQAEFIAEIKLRNLNKEYLLGRIKELDALKGEIAELSAVLGSEGLVHDIITRQLRDIAKKYGKPRRTAIVYEEHIPEISDEVFIEDYGIRIFLTEHNYFKKIPLTSLRTAPEQNLKDDDRILQELETNNRSELIMFSNKNAAYKVRAHELNDCKASGLGEYLTNTLSLEPDEVIRYIAVANDYRGYMLFAFENGKVAKVPLDSYATKSNRKKLLNAYSDRSKPVSMEYIAQDGDFVLIRDKDKALLVNTALIEPVASKSSGGVTVFTLKKNSKVTRLMAAELFASDDGERYRSDKIPSAGHFMMEKEKSQNKLVPYIQLGITE